MNIRQLPRFILSCLTRLHPDDILPCNIESRSFARSINRLPTEIVDMILKHLQGLEDPPLACNRLLRPYLWRRALVTQDIFPWLWDIKRLIRTDRGRAHQVFPWLRDSHRSENVSHGLDQEGEGLNIEEYMRFKLLDNKWDWELLVRQWAQKDVFEPGTYRQDLHLALRNRRRIWRILEEMRLDDVEIITEWPAPAGSSAATEYSERMSELGEGSFEPVEGRYEPGESNSEPGEGTSEPGMSTGEPEECTSEPGMSTSEHGEGTSEPGMSTSEPGETTSEPGMSTSEPGEGTSEPGMSTSAPEGNTSEPGESTSEPGEITSEPGESMSE